MLALNAPAALRPIKPSLPAAWGDGSYEVRRQLPVLTCSAYATCYFPFLPGNASTSQRVFLWRHESARGEGNEESG